MTAEVQPHRPQTGFKQDRKPRADALAICDNLAGILDEIGVAHEFLGSIRRCKPTVGDLDIMLVTDDGADPYLFTAILRRMTGHHLHVRLTGSRWLSVVVDGFLCEFKQTTPEQAGAARLMMTGSGVFNIGMRAFAKRQGYKLNQYGLFIRDTDQLVASRTEQDIFAAMGVEYVPPQERIEFHPVADPFAGYEAPVLDDELAFV